MRRLPLRLILGLALLLVSTGALAQDGEGQAKPSILVIWGVANGEDLKTLAKAFKGSVEVE